MNAIRTHLLNLFDKERRKGKFDLRIKRTANMTELPGIKINNTMAIAKRKILNIFVCGDNAIDLIS
jgi:hypothetical protein